MVQRNLLLIRGSIAIYLVIFLYEPSRILVKQKHTVLIIMTTADPKKLSKRKPSGYTSSIKHINTRYNISKILYISVTL